MNGLRRDDQDSLSRIPKKKKKKSIAKSILQDAEADFL